MKLCFIRRLLHAHRRGRVMHRPAYRAGHAVCQLLCQQARLRFIKQFFLLCKRRLAGGKGGIYLFKLVFCLLCAAKLFRNLFNLLQKFLCAGGGLLRLLLQGFFTLLCAHACGKLGNALFGLCLLLLQRFAVLRGLPGVFLRVVLLLLQRGNAARQRVPLAVAGQIGGKLFYLLAQRFAPGLLCRRCGGARLQPCNLQFGLCQCLLQSGYLRFGLCHGVCRRFGPLCRALYVALRAQCGLQAGNVALVLICLCVQCRKLCLRGVAAAQLLQTLLGLFFFGSKGKLGRLQPICLCLLRLVLHFVCLYRGLQPRQHVVCRGIGPLPRQQRVLLC